MLLMIVLWLTAYLRLSTAMLGKLPSAAYFRRQADICLRLSLISSDEEISHRLILMAEEYKAKAVAIEVASKSAPAEVNPAEKEPGHRAP
jgi:hypothetical protein